MSNRRAFGHPARQRVVSCRATSGSLLRAPQTIGLTKTDRDDTPVNITLSIGEAVRRAELGADTSALDASLSPQPHPVNELVKASHAAGTLFMADTGTPEKMLATMGDGADIATTRQKMITGWYAEARRG